MFYTGFDICLKAHCNVKGRNRSVHWSFACYFPVALQLSHLIKLASLLSLNAALLVYLLVELIMQSNWLLLLVDLKK